LRRIGSAAADEASPTTGSHLVGQDYGTTHLIMSPLEFMQRLAALVPRPRLHLISLVSA